MSVWSNIDFLLSIREEKFAGIFEFFQSTGWWLLLLIGVVWFAVRWYARHNREPNKAATWPMVASCSVVAFLFGVLLAVRSSGGVPKVITSWGNPGAVCSATLDASRLLSFKDKYKLGIACGVMDPTMERLDDDRITVSNPFEIVKGGISIVAPHRAEMMKLLQTGVTERVQIWYEAVLIPNGVRPSKITRLNDLLSAGGKIINEQYFR